MGDGCPGLPAAGAGGGGSLRGVQFKAAKLGHDAPEAVVIQSKSSARQMPGKPSPQRSTAAASWPAC